MAPVQWHHYEKRLQENVKMEIRLQLTFERANGSRGSHKTKSLQRRQQSNDLVRSLYVREAIVNTESPPLTTGK